MTLTKSLRSFLLILNVRSLISKEFKYHQLCYREFTRPIKRKSAETERSYSQQDDHLKVKEIIEKNVLLHHQAISMALHEAFELETNDNRYRYKLKERLINDYRNKIMFVKSHYHHPEIVIGADSVNSNLLLNNKDVIIKEAAQLLRSDIIEYLNNLPEIPWPPHIDSFDEAKHFSNSLIQFLECLVKSPGRETKENVKRIVSSFASDFIKRISGKKITTAKHLALALGLHNMTGQKKVIQILKQLGHCISNDLTCEIKTSQAQVFLIEQEIIRSF